DAAHAPVATRRAGCGADVDDAARSATLGGVALPLALGPDVREAHDAGQECSRGRQFALPQARALQPADLALDRHGTAVQGSEGAAQGPPALDRAAVEAGRVDEGKGALTEAGLDRPGVCAVAREPIAPIGEAVRGHGESDLDGETVTLARGCHLGPG